MRSDAASLECCVRDDREARIGLTDSAEVQVHESPENAGHSVLTLGVLPLEPERRRLETAGLKPGAIETADDYYLLRLRDPDGNLIMVASARSV